MGIVTILVQKNRELAKFPRKYALQMHFQRLCEEKNFCPNNFGAKDVRLIAVYGRGFAAMILLKQSVHIELN